jgi:hypothetical protein
MNQNVKERTVYQKDEPELFEHLESMMFSGTTDLEEEGVMYRASRDKDEQGRELFVLTPIDARVA